MIQTHSNNVVAGLRIAIFTCCCCLPAGVRGQMAELPQTVSSPKEVVSADIQFDDQGRIRATIKHGEQVLVTTSLVLEFSDGGRLGEGMKLVDVRHTQHDTTYSIPVGKASSARDHYRELTVSLEEAANPSRKLNLQFRAFDDGVAFRYVVPHSSEESDTLALIDEYTTLTFPEDPMAWTLPLNSFTTPYETKYQPLRVTEVKSESLIGLPLLTRHDRTEHRSIWMAITEANLSDYAGMYLARDSAAKSATLVSKLSPLPNRTDNAKVIAQTPLTSPWRVCMISDDFRKLLESDIVFNLNEPSRIADSSWIRPGKTTFPWWNGYALTNVDFKPGVNTETMKHYIDFCAENGIPYHSLDGLNIAWYGGPIRPSVPVDVTTAAPTIDMPELLSYAKDRRVRLRLWMHWRALKPQLDEAFATYERWGIEGVMIDFMDRDDQEMVRWYYEVAEKAAKHHLTVTWHGAYKPTGMERTWPNVLSYEGVLNQEYNKWQPNGEGATPGHNLDVAFIRMLAGPLDYHQGGMRSMLPEDYTPQSNAPPVQGTRGHQLAMYVVYQNHLSMMADSPSSYRGQPELPFLVDIPATWDETRVLHAEIGQCIVIARRRDNTWYLGGMTADRPQELNLSLAFLRDGRFDSELYLDDESRGPTATIRQTAKVTSDGPLKVFMPRFGGFAGRVVRSNIR